MRAGRLDTTIQIQRASASLDAAGTPSTVWTTIASPRAQVLQQSTEEFLSRAGATDETVTIFRTRYLAVAVNNSDRIIHGGLVHNIRETKPIGRKRGLEIRTISLDQVA